MKSMIPENETHACWGIISWALGRKIVGNEGSRALCWLVWSVARSLIGILVNCVTLIWSWRLSWALVVFALNFTWIWLGSRGTALWGEVSRPTTLLPGVSPDNGEEEPFLLLAQNLVISKVVSLLAGVWWLTFPKGRLLLADSGLASSLLWHTVYREVVRSVVGLSLGVSSREFTM